VSRGAAIGAGTVAAATLVGGVTAVATAASLYNFRQTLANQFQNQLQFPSDLTSPDAGGEGRNFFMGFSFMKYEKRSINNSPFLRSEGTVRLPIPDGIRDNLSVSYNTASLTPMVGAGLEAVAGTNPNGATLGSVSRGVVDTLAGRTIGLLQGAADSSPDGRALGQATQAFLGLAVNPYQTVLFEKPEFKTHNFSWKLMPRSEDESVRAKNIFRTFQFHASPGVAGGAGLFFTYPSMVIISLHPSSDFLYRFKPCVIKSVNVNYAAGSNPSFFKKTNAPTAMTLSIQLQEIEYWTNNDYNENAFSDNAAIFELQNRRARANTPITSGPSGGTP
jgi:hypothetical protein